MSTNPEAEKHRLAGNEHFKAGRFEQAIAAYSAAIDVEASPSLYSTLHSRTARCWSGFKCSARNTSAESTMAPCRATRPTTSAC